MRTPEQQEEYLAHSRFGEGALGEHPIWKQIGTGSSVLAGTILFAVLGWFVLRLSGEHITLTVAEDKRSYAHGAKTTFGYSIKKYRFNADGFQVHIWAGPSLNLRFEVPGIELRRVKREQWIAGERAVLIGLDTAYDSADSELWFLYDFERRELRSCGIPGGWLRSELEKWNTTNTSCKELLAHADSLK